MTHQSEREAIARLIDPKTWEKSVETRPFFKDGKLVGESLLNPISLREWDELTAPSLAAADAILALRPPVGTGTVVIDAPDDTPCGMEDGKVYSVGARDYVYHADSERLEPVVEPGEIIAWLRAMATPQAPVLEQAADCIAALVRERDKACGLLRGLDNAMIYDEAGRPVRFDPHLTCEVWERSRAFLSQEPRP